MNRSKIVALGLGLGLALQASAYESLLGEYSGTLVSLEGQSGTVGDPCTAVIGRSDLFGGAVMFEMRNIEKLVVETRRVESALQQASGTVKIHTPGGSGQPAEIVILKFGSDGALRALKLARHWAAQHRERSATCGDLKKLER